MDETIRIASLDSRIKDYKTKFLRTPKNHKLFMSTIEDLALEPGVVFEKDTSTFQAVYLELRKFHVKAGCNKRLCK
ncbi:MAG: hypothetical protein UR56_C0024G0005 [Candidatus Roizmanbacteria bacterium GW2011_GWC2_34_23]|uniref:Uncharacterized protein n=1 Tax=Candidatus Roizmanbacteria bacterium GW2011_GWC2_34_23 TaxID=1618484 RepID=A0A0G0ATF4_9BACT|nr:MAG: hypothetical protein UR56_C0024G0005 [Candidatus Roizmanbacteria bacterium GW2011_GWC2_34_23]